MGATAPRLPQVRRRTWIAVGAGFRVPFGLFVRAALALIGGLFGPASGWLGTARDAAAGPAQGVLEQVEPGAREQLDAHLKAYLPALKGRSEPAHDGARVTVEYSGRAGYGAVLGPHARGYADLGYAGTVLSADPDAETHENAKGAERYSVTVARKGHDGVSVRVESARS